MTVPWPLPQTPRSRLLAWLEHRAGRYLRLLTEHGEVIELEDYESLRAAMFDLNLLVFTFHLGAHEWVDDALSDDFADISATRGNVIPSVRLAEQSKRHPEKRGRRARWIVDAGETWGFRLDTMKDWPLSSPELQIFMATEFLRDLRILFDACEVGDHPTPSALGNALAGREYPKEADRLYRPCLAAWQDFKRNLVGGRADLLEPGEEFEKLYELDMNFAYAAAMQETPSGPACWWEAKNHRPDCGGAEPCDHEHDVKAPYPVNYCYCRVSAPEHFDLPLAYLEAIDRSIVGYPRDGSWEGWYWDESIETARRFGYVITVIAAWGFPKLTNDFAAWSNKMDELRRALPRQASYVKLAAVAFIGRLAVDDIRKVVKRNGNSARVFCSPDRPVEYHYEWACVDSPSMLPHLNSYVQMRMRNWLFAKALAEGANLVATNYDAVYTVREPQQLSSFALGGWKATVLTHVWVPLSRWLISDQKTVTPGVPQKLRHKYSIAEMRGAVWSKDRMAIPGPAP
jgi:hypothetical protein